MSREQAMTFLDQFEQARANIRQMKRDTPWAFKEYAQLKAAEERVRQAKDSLKLAQEKWAKLGNAA